MKAPRLSEVTARVVAWHNRHPLARRIDPTQVHSIGAVQLPFASAQAWSGATSPARPGSSAPADAAATPADIAAPTLTLAEALAQRTARQQPAADAAGIAGLEVQPMLPDADVDIDLFAPPAAAADVPAPAEDVDLALDAPDQPPEDDGDGEAALVIPLLDGDDAAADARADTSTADEDRQPAAAGAALAADDGGGDSGDIDHSGSNDSPPVPALVVPADPVEPMAAPALPGAHDDPVAAPDAPLPPEVYPPPHGTVPASALARAVERRTAARGAGATAAHEALDAPDPPPPGRWRRWLNALRRSITGRQPGLPPLRAAFSRDFIWPLRPGQVARWAQRHGRPQAVAPADWPQRCIDTDRARLATLRQKGLAHDLPLHVLTAAIGVGDRRIRVLLGADGSVLGPRAYSRARVGSAAALLAVGLVGAGWGLRPLHGTDADDGAAALAALAAASAASAASAPASAAMAALGASAADGSASATTLAAAASAADAAASGAPAAHADASASAPVDGHATSAAVADTAASQPQASIRPALSDDTKYAARLEAAKLRGEPPPAPPPEAVQGPVYAVVSPPSRQREAAAGSLVLMQASAGRLSGPLPDHGELLESQGQWRAAWWPFASLVDAERARVLLAGKGLKAEVIEF